jgi:transcriptional regulator with XRE-family HTH domain
VHPLTEAVGRVVERRRRAAGYSWRTFGVRCGVSGNTIRNLERGSRNARLDIVARVARGLGLAAWELLREAELPSVGRHT